MKAMKRVSDGEIMPYSQTLVAAKPGAYVEMAWDAETRQWNEKDGVPLVSVPTPVQPGTIPDDMGEEQPAAEYHDPEPETLDTGDDAPVETGKRRRSRK